MSVWGAPALLSDGVRFVDYIESTGTQWIDTGLPARVQLRAEIDVQCVSSSPSDQTILGGNGSGQTDAMYLGYNWSSSFRSYYFNLTGSWLDLYGQADLLRHRLDVSFQSGAVCIRKDADTLYTAATALTGADSARHLCVFRRPNGNNPALARLYGLKIWDFLSGGALVRDLRPALDEHGEPCLYDAVTRQCCRNAGTGRFLYG